VSGASGRAQPDRGIAGGASEAYATIWPLLLIARASHGAVVRSLGSGRLVMVPLLYRKGCEPLLIAVTPAAHELAPADFLATVASELNGTSKTATYAPPYNRGTRSVQRLLLSPQTWPGTT
jgi:hypothetical protein